MFIPGRPTQAEGDGGFAAWESWPVFSGHTLGLAGRQAASGGVTSGNSGTSAETHNGKPPE